MDRDRFPAECRRFLTSLVDQLDAGRSDPHAESCARCRRHLAAALRQQGVLRQLARPALPSRAEFDTVLAGVHERIAADLPAGLEAALAGALTPLQAPAMPDFLERVAERVALSKRSHSSVSR